MLGWCGATRPFTSLLLLCPSLGDTRSFKWGVQLGCCGLRCEACQTIVYGSKFFSKSIQTLWYLVYSISGGGIQFSFCSELSSTIQLYSGLAFQSGIWTTPYNLISLRQMSNPYLWCSALNKLFLFGLGICLSIWVSAFPLQSSRIIKVL